MSIRKSGRSLLMNCKHAAALAFPVCICVVLGAASKVRAEEHRPLTESERSLLLASPHYSEYSVAFAKWEAKCQPILAEADACAKRCYVGGCYVSNGCDPRPCINACFAQSHRCGEDAYRALSAIKDRILHLSKNGSQSTHAIPRRETAAPKAPESHERISVSSRPEPARMPIKSSMKPASVDAVSDSFSGQGLTNPLILNDSKMPEFLSPAHDDVANRAGRRACASRSIGWNWFMIF